MKDTHKHFNRMNKPYNVTAKRHTLQKRVKTTIRVDEETWQQFIEKVKSHHLSSCLALEALMSAYVYGGSVVPGQTGPQVVNVTIEREEMRPKRREDEKYMREKQKKRASEFHDGLGRPKNHYDPLKGWYHDENLDPDMIVVEQPRQWKGEDKGFTWSEGGQKWWKKK